MPSVLNSDQNEKLKKIVDSSLSIKERVAKLVDSLSNIDPTDKLSKVLEAIVAEESVLKESYKSICDSIASELFQLLTESNELKSQAVKIDVELLSKEKELNKYCSIYAKIPPLQENKDDPNYKYFLGKYEQGVKLSQQIAEVNFKAVDLIDVQKTLDHAFANNIVELDYLVKNLMNLIKVFKFVRTPVLINKYKENYCAYKNLKKMVDDKNAEFDELLKKLGFSRDSKSIDNIIKDSDTSEEVVTK